MMKRFFAVRHQASEVDIVLLLIRLFMGYAFIMHGWGKIQNPMAWMGPSAPVPGFFQLLAAISEFGGGIALILGLLTRLGSLGITFTMIVAVITHTVMMGDPLINQTGGRAAEPAAVYLLLALLFVVMGPGRFSLDRKIFGFRN